MHIKLNTPSKNALLFLSSAASLVRSHRPFTKRFQTPTTEMHKEHFQKQCATYLTTPLENPKS